MKRFAIFVAILVVLAAPVALAEEPFAIDAIHTYDNMARPYAQGYAPLIRGNTAYIVLPLMSDVCESDITAQLTPGNLDATPIKLENDFSQTVQRGPYIFSDEKVSAYNAYFKLSLHASRLNGEYPCQITVRGKDGAGNALRQTFSVTLRVSDGRANDEVPDVGIEAFDVGEALYVGGSGTLRMKVTNRSGTREVRGVTLTIADSTGDILPQSSDTVSVGTLAAGESVPIEIPVHALAKASAEPHAIEFSLSYGYAENKTATKSEKRTIDIQQEVRLNHTEAALPSRVTQGENVAFNLTLMNMGKGTLYNALLTFDVPHMAAGGSVLAGDIEPGKSAQATANLRVDGDSEGETRGTLTLTWEDGYGKAYEKTLPLSTTVIKKAAPATIGASASGTEDAPDGRASVREIFAWCMAITFLTLFGVNAMRSSRKIRKLEEKQL